MQSDVYRDLAKQEETHWWFKARRRILYTILKKNIPAKQRAILEIGCGTGGNLSMLKEFGRVSAIEMDDYASTYASKMTGIDVKTGWLPDNIPVQEKFDAICMFDVLEHVKDDELALEKIRNLLNPNGILILTVPAHQWLYGPHDKMHHHYRRYSAKTLKRILPINNMEVIRISHFNFFLFPLLIIARIVDIFLKQKKSIGYNTPNKLLNILFYKIFVFERCFLNRINFPFGGSAFAIAKKYRSHG